MERIFNSVLELLVSEHGAELQSIRKEEEYLWQGDARFWGRRSPVLFPCVGRVWNNNYRHDGKTYEIGQHGFARDMDFELINHTADEVVYRLVSTAETLQRFPFAFELRVGYRLDGNRITVNWQVKNTGNEPMPFQIGAHPAFYFPDFNVAEEVKGYFAFNKQEGLEYIVPQEKGCVSPVRHTLELDADGLMPIHSKTFDCDTYIFDSHQLSQVTLLARDKRPVLRLEFKSPLVALWSPTAVHPDCPFVCIEPWYGRCDAVGYSGEWKDREWMQQLDPQQEFEASYDIVIL